MYWTLDARPPTLDELIISAEKRVHDAIERHCQAEAPQIENRWADNASSAQDVPVEDSGYCSGPFHLCWCYRCLAARQACHELNSLSHSLLGFSLT